MINDSVQLATSESSQVVKRIISIGLENFRGYFGKYEPINLLGGENLLIYGENGSGKSSLFKALNDFFASSLNTQYPFTKNRYLANEDGSIRIAFSDFGIRTATRIENTNIEFEFSSRASNNTAPFIRNAALIRGFLDYRNLLDVYFHRKSNPNLFDLIVLSLLGSHIPLSSGGNFQFKEKWIQLQKDLIDNAYTRQSRCHKIAKTELPIFHTHLSATLNEVFVELNQFLTRYFPDLKIQLNFLLPDFTFNYSYYKFDWYTSAELFLKVTKDGLLIEDDYSDVLNEARLSAFAICLYLASLKRNPANVNLKILYLDDIFIGLDASNRIPILNILENEFSDYQIFISTYDLHTFRLAKRFFETVSPNRWNTSEFYVGNGEKDGINFDKPLVIQNDDEFTRGIHHLHHTIKPDYPACANYFRKYAEEILTTDIPSHEIRDINDTLIENYKLSNLVSASLNFLSKINANNLLLLELKRFLPTLLHPLSHFNLSSPIYKRELLEIQKCLSELRPYLRNLALNYRMFIPASKIVKLKLNASPTEVGVYEIAAKEMIYLINDGEGNLRLSNGNCYAKAIYLLSNGTPTYSRTISKNETEFQYTSIENSYDSIFSHISTEAKFSHLTKATNYLTEFEINDGTSWRNLINLLTW